MVHLLLVAAVKAHARAVPSRAADVGLQSGPWAAAVVAVESVTDLAHIEVVAAKVRAHAVPARAADAVPQNNPSMPTGLVAKSVTDHTQIEVCEESGLVWGDRNS